MQVFLLDAIHQLHFLSHSAVRCWIDKRKYRRLVETVRQQKAFVGRFLQDIAHLSREAEQQMTEGYYHDIDRNPQALRTADLLG